MIKSFKELHRATLDKLKGKKAVRLGAVNPIGTKYLEAIARAVNEGFIEPFLFGPENKIKETAKQSGIDIEKFHFVDVTDSKQAVNKSIEMVNEKKLALLIKCNIGTREFVDMLCASGNNFVSKKSSFTHIGVVQTERYPKLMFITDGGVVPEPDAAQFIQMVQNAATVCNKLGNVMPKAALLAAVEAIYPAIQTTMLEAAIAKMSDRGQIKDVLIDGPLSFDVAINAEVAHSKGITNSKVVGDTDIFAMPNMETANGTYKAMVMYAEAEAASIFYGAPVSIAASSAVDSSQNIFNSIALAVYLA